jgi:hypothetical protein
LNAFSEDLAVCHEGMQAIAQAISEEAGGLHWVSHRMHLQSIEQASMRRALMSIMSSLGCWFV